MRFVSFHVHVHFTALLACHSMEFSQNYNLKPPENSLHCPNITKSILPDISYISSATSCSAFAQSFTVITRSRTLSSKLEYAWHIMSTFWRFCNCHVETEHVSQQCQKKCIKDGFLKSLHSHVRLEKLGILQWKCIVAREIYLQSPCHLSAFKEGLAALRIDLQLQPSTYHYLPNRTQQYCWLISRRIPISNLCFLALEDYTTLHSFTIEQMAHRLFALFSFAADKVRLDCDCKLLASNSPSKQSLRIGTLACKTCKCGPKLSTRSVKKSLCWNCEFRMLLMLKSKVQTCAVCRCLSVFQFRSHLLSHGELRVLPQKGRKAFTLANSRTWQHSTAAFGTRRA